jgi:hypothetical protein
LFLIGLLALATVTLRIEYRDSEWTAHLLSFENAKAGNQNSLVVAYSGCTDVLVKGTITPNNMREPSESVVSFYLSHFHDS